MELPSVPFKQIWNPTFKAFGRLLSLFFTKKQILSYAHKFLAIDIQKQILIENVRFNIPGQEFTCEIQYTRTRVYL